MSDFHPLKKEKSQPLKIVGRQTDEYQIISLLNLPGKKKEKKYSPSARTTAVKECF